MKLLFICSRNRWRSPTAEKIFRSQLYATKSAGTEPSARIKVTEKLIGWADLIFVMEKKHRQRLIDKFLHLMADKIVITLHIADEYQYMDEELIETLKLSVQPYLNQYATAL